MLGEKETVVIARHFNDHLRINPRNYEDQHESYDYEVVNKEGERITVSYLLKSVSPSIGHLIKI